VLRELFDLDNESWLEPVKICFFFIKILWFMNQGQ
jgi:hypothetical protein